MRCNTKQSVYSASSLYMFQVSTAPFIRSTQNCNYSLQYWSYFCAATSLATLEGGSCTVPEAVVTVLCTHDDGCGWHPKHVQWTCRIINRLLCVAFHWAIINIELIQSTAISFLASSWKTQSRQQDGEVTGKYFDEINIYKSTHGN